MTHEVTEDEAKNIERATVDQADSAQWFKERRVRLTASHFGKVTREIAQMVPSWLKR